MGRQIQIAASIDDENELIEFLRSDSDIQIFEHFGESEAVLFVDHFSKTIPGHFHYFLWNTGYSWTPEFSKNRKGNYYISNSGAAPLLELSRSNLSQKEFGRIYWAKDFSAPNGLDYDVTQFERWFDSIVHWIRTRASKQKIGHTKIWVLPHAMEQMGCPTSNKAE